MTTIRYPGAESVEEITSRFMLSMPGGMMPMLCGFRYDGTSIAADFVPAQLTEDHSELDPHPIHASAAQLRRNLGSDMFGFGLVFIVFADQLDGRDENRHIPAQIHTAAEQLPGADDLIAAVTIDATGRQWWAVVPRHLQDLEPVRIHVPSAPREDWQIPDNITAWLWMAALALDQSNRPRLRQLLAEPEGNSGGAASFIL
ncbi:hypothetical protein [Nocardia wallacei]|uniref:hypothetical protein n=1 Tax=Nocardia wallacei TaxID=480035 RepID=UPI0024544BAD|nr:hypothetical protein [Nocardia wallacei]